MSGALFFEFDLEDSEKVRERNDELKVKMKDDPYGYPALMPSYMTGLGEGFRVVEAGARFRGVPGLQGMERDNLRLVVSVRLVSMSRSAR